MRRTLVRAALWLIAAVLAALLGAIVLLQSGWFRNQVRSRLIAVVQDATGGSVEIGAFSFDWRRLTATVAPFVVHGLEPAGSPPLFRAGKIEAEMRIISLLEERVDLVSLIVENPQWTITVQPDGRTNVPQPRRKRPFAEHLVQDLLNVKIQRFLLRGGSLRYNALNVPVDATARDASVDLRFQPLGPSYTGNINVGSLRIVSPAVDIPEFSFASTATLERSQLRIVAARLSLRQSEIRASGLVRNFAAPQGRLDLQADVKLHDVPPAVQVPLSTSGTAAFEGAFTFALEPSLTWTLAGKASGRGLEIRNKLVTIANAGVAAAIQITPAALQVQDLSLTALGGAFHGRLDVSNWKSWTLRGNLRDVSVRELARARQSGATSLNGRLSGAIHAQGQASQTGIHDVLAEALLALEPGSDGVPLQGSLDLHYDQRANLVRLGDSQLNLGTSRLELSGTLGQSLAVRATSRNLNDVFSAMPLLGERVPQDVPVLLQGGTARFEGVLAGPLRNPRISGQAEATRLRVHGQDFDRLLIDFDLSDSELNARALTLTQGNAQLRGTARLGLNHWSPAETSPVSGSLTLAGVDLAKALEGRKPEIPVSGTLAGTVEIQGTLGSPAGTADVHAAQFIAYGEPLTAVRARASLSGSTLQLLDAHAGAASGEVAASGSYQHEPSDWTTGRLTFQASGRGLALARMQRLQDFRSGSAGAADLSAKGTARLTRGELRLESLTSQASLRDLAFDGRAYGNLNISANSRAETLDVKMSAQILGAAVEGSGEWKLSGDDPGHGEIVAPHVTLAALHELVPNPTRVRLPFDGYVEGKAAIEGPLRKPDEMKAHVVLTALQVNASAGAKPRAGALARDLVLRNAKPLVFDVTSQGLEIRSAQLAGTDTTIVASGRLSLGPKSSWDLRLNGAVNLAILQIFNPDLLGSGISVVDAAVRGPALEPQVEGRLELKNASLYLRDLPNGLDQASGLIVFDRSRATVDSLTAVTGGGRVTIQKGSFVGFRGPVLLYRVQASADNVRYRSPEGVSLTVNGVIGLTGTSENSVLSGTVTVMRVGFNPTTDVGSLLATTARPVAAPSTPNEYLKGIQFDVRVESAQSLEIQTSLTRNVEAEANLRLRGTPERPIVLGSLTVTEGQIDFFGNRYHINRGEVNFYNTTKIEPIIDMDLETIVRGITVDISFSGPLNKLNFSYRSDPPLQTNDIIALLAVGRTPSANPLASSQTATNTNYLSTGSNGLLAQAISAPAAGRLQRFFGVSHIRIDPQLSDITSVPQARLSIEQQISKDITLTYITNVTRTQEQIIRVEWNLTQQWSVVALRDENGEFGIDFQYRRRFK